MAEVSIRFLDGESDDKTLTRLYDTVIAPGFVAAEREPPARLRRVLAADELRGAIAVTPDGEPVGALFLEWFADIRAALLCYFAVRPDLRGSGIGRRLIAEAAPRWRAELRPHVVFAEAGDPDSHGHEPGAEGTNPHGREAGDPDSHGHEPGAEGTNSHGREAGTEGTNPHDGEPVAGDTDPHDRAAGTGGTASDGGSGGPEGGDFGDDDARLRLYAGFGARRLPLPYLMPELAPGAGRLGGLLLLVVEVDEAVSPSADRIRSAIVADFLERYFTRQEGSPLRDDDGRLGRLLTESRRGDVLPLLPLH
ncbi:GNAT family N-acetyltransferase [Actinoplanes sp. CA-252034]|uniref:GNAT family N-acetyltransferase n=1 Tax=Actinoplanes sp. CA-252034 TaxID=3239906 RepID=UPI003D988CD1